MDARRNLDRALERVARADAKIVDAVEPHRETPPVKALSFASKIGDQPPLRTLSASLILAGLLASNARLARAGARMLLAHELATVAKNFVKDRVDRTRPRSAQSLSDRKMRAGRNPTKEESSFPSGHSAGALAVARAFSREFPEYQGLAHTAASLVAIAQVPRCAHYLTDVGAGLVIGAAAEAVINQAWRSAEAVGQPLIANGSQLP